MSYVFITLFFASPNFATDDTSLANAAEAARFRSALFWTNQPLAGNWAKPCPVIVQSRDTAVGGATSFVFDRGEVFGWSMTLAGRRESIFADALPHEVDHMVRATLVRRPILRWLDEGAAALFESRDEHARHRERAIAFARSGRVPTFLTARDYPTNASDIADLYAVGYSLTEHLLKLGTPKQLLALQASTDSLDRTLQRTHGLKAGELVESWRTAVLANPATDCRNAGCLMHRPAEHVVGCNLGTCRRPNRMVVWTAAWCGACRQFWNDYRTDTEFRAAVDARVHIHHADVDRHPVQARMNHVRSLPTFVTSRGHLEGYRDKQRFLDRLEAIGGSTSRSTSVSDAGDRTLSEQRPPETPSAYSGAANDQTDIPDRSGLSTQQAPSSRVDQEVDPPHDRMESGIACSSPSRFYTVAGVTLTALDWFGLAGAATGPLGIALGALALIKKRRRSNRTAVTSHAQQADPHSRPREVPLSNTPPHEPNAQPPPFPRELDEARELLRLRQREGRVAALDAIRGMVVDDELDRLTAEGHGDVAARLRQQLNDRIQQIAPISTSEYNGKKREREA